MLYAIIPEDPVMPDPNDTPPPGRDPSAPPPIEEPEPTLPVPDPDLPPGHIPEPIQDPPPPANALNRPSS